MKLIIAGSRKLRTPVDIMTYFLDSLNIDYRELGKDFEIVSGGAKGSDESGENWAISYRLCGLKVFPADWDGHGKAAGPIRNRKMANYADALLLIWDGKSRGSQNMKNEMLKLKKPIYEVILTECNVSDSGEL